MRKQAASLALASALSLTIAVPAFASHTATHTTPPTTTTINSTTNTTSPTYNPRMNQIPYNGGIYNDYFNDANARSRTGTGMVGTYNAYGTNNDGVNRYGAYDSTRMNAYRPYSTNLTEKINHPVRTLETTTKRTFNWGWLGLLGLFGLAGMRSKSRDEVR
ncbi:WGxxGxxG family protein [Cohnella soli]|uniref:WGxxGxxG family protein n=1 Tax=Cohnella soli TaxID=425005 RepID=A0ABW0HW90_9BACL